MFVRPEAEVVLFAEELFTNASKGAPIELPDLDS